MSICGKCKCSSCVFNELNNMRDAPICDKGCDLSCAAESITGWNMRQACTKYVKYAEDFYSLEDDEFYSQVLSLLEEATND